MSAKFFIFLPALVLVLGLVFLFGLNFYLNQHSLISPNPALGPVTREPVSLTLNLSSPDDDQMVFAPGILIQGQTIPEATVILSSEDTDQVLEVESRGNFSTTIKLQPGLNQLKVTAFDNSGNSKSEERTVYYSIEKI